MSRNHLGTGSTKPDKVEGKLRLYSMEYCPYAHRARLVLLAKNVPHDVVNINLVDKPEWYFDVHSEGKVPALDTGTKIIIESLDIADYLDDTYPDPPLYPSDPEQKQKDKELIKKIDSLSSVFMQCILDSTKKQPEGWVQDILQESEVFENALNEKNKTFFGGDKPGMVDYMLWPWAERQGVIAIILGQKLPFPDDKLPRLRQWRKAMSDVDIVKSIYTGPEKFYKAIQIKFKKIPPDYDN